MARTRAADDFATIRARVEELRREREVARAAKGELQSDEPRRSARMYTCGGERTAGCQDGFDSLARSAAGPRRTKSDAHYPPNYGSAT